METTQMRTRKDHVELVIVGESATTVGVSEKLEGRQGRVKDEFHWKQGEVADMPSYDAVRIGGAGGLLTKSGASCGIGSGSGFGFLWWVLNWKQGQKLG